MRDYYIYGALLTFSLALFGNTWSAGFAFDDNFAVVGVSSAINVLVYYLTMVYANAGQQW